MHYVVKRWTKTEGRQFLVEQVEVLPMARALKEQEANEPVPVTKQRPERGNEKVAQQSEAPPWVRGENPTFSDPFEFADKLSAFEPVIGSDGA